MGAHDHSIQQKKNRKKITAHENDLIKTHFQEIWEEGTHHLFVLVRIKGNVVPFDRSQVIVVTELTMQGSCNKR